MLWLAVLSFAASAAGPEARIAVFDFTLVNSSPAATTKQETERLQQISDDIRKMLVDSGQYALVDVTPLREKIVASPDIRACNGCERDMAASLGASLAGYGWVQKVSNLILNINFVIEDVRTGQILKAGSVDIRGNTDESWQRGVRYLAQEHLLNSGH